MPRAIWKGSISFGLVTIPVKGAQHAYALLRETLKESGRVGIAKIIIREAQNLAAEWDPSKYTDQYRDNLMKLIKARMKGERPKLPPAAEEPADGKVVDLMERLRQSLASREAGRGRSKAVGKKTKAKPKTRHAA